MNDPNCAQVCLADTVISLWHLPTKAVALYVRFTMAKFVNGFCFATFCTTGKTASGNCIRI